jgi:ABC-2 type transport system permease protein
MTSFIAFFNKEFKGQLRTYRLLIVVAVFFVFGLGIPLLLKYMQALLPSGEVGIVLPEYTAADVAGEFLDTLGQMGLIAAILITMGMVANERESGTAGMTLSKPVGCGTFIAAKLTALALTFGVGIVVGAIGCYIYTVVLFGSLNLFNFTAATLLAMLYLFVCIAVTLMFSSFFRSQLAAGALALVVLLAMTGTAGLPGLKYYSPGALLAWSKNVALDSNDHFWGALIIGLVVIILTTVIGWQVFKRKEL